MSVIVWQAPQRSIINWSASPPSSVVVWNAPQRSILNWGTSPPSSVMAWSASQGASGSSTQFVDAADDLTMVAGTCYRADDPDDQVLFSLPVGLSFGAALIYVTGYNLGGWKIIQRNGEQITIAGSSNATTTGTTGYIQNLNINDALILIPIAPGIFNALTFGGVTIN